MKNKILFLAIATITIQIKSGQIKSDGVGYTIDKNDYANTRKYNIDSDNTEVMQFFKDDEPEDMFSNCKKFCNSIGLTYTSGFEWGSQWSWWKFKFVPRLACFCDKTPVNS